VDATFPADENVNPDRALHEQIERYRRMTGEQRLALALELHELSCNVAREGIRSALKVNFWLPTPAPFDKEMLRRRARVTLFGEPAWITTAEDCVLHKLVWNKVTPSERQLGDAAGVVAVQDEKLDMPYLKRWGEALGVAAELNQLLRGEIRPKRT
jgi:hypothetical protein